MTLTGGMEAYTFYNPWLASKLCKS